MKEDCIAINEKTLIDAEDMAGTELLIVELIQRNVALRADIECLKLELERYCAS